MKTDFRDSSKRTFESRENYDEHFESTPKRPRWGSIDNCVENLSIVTSSNGQSSRESERRANMHSLLRIDPVELAKISSISDDEIDYEDEEKVAKSRNSSTEEVRNFKISSISDDEIDEDEDTPNPGRPTEEARNSTSLTPHLNAVSLVAPSASISQAPNHGIQDEEPLNPSSCSTPYPNTTSSNTPLDLVEIRRSNHDYFGLILKVEQERGMADVLLYNGETWPTRIRDISCKLASNMVEARDCNNNGLEIGDFIVVNHLDDQGRRQPHGNCEGLIMSIHSGYVFYTIPVLNSFVFVSKTRNVRKVVSPIPTNKTSPIKPSHQSRIAYSKKVLSPSPQKESARKNSKSRRSHLKSRQRSRSRSRKRSRSKKSFRDRDVPTLSDDSGIEIPTITDDPTQEIPKSYIMSGRWCVENLYVRVIQDYGIARLIDKEGVIRHVKDDGKSYMVYYANLKESFRISCDLLLPVRPRNGDRAYVIYGTLAHEEGKLYQIGDKFAIKSKDSIFPIPITYVCKTV